MYKVNDPALLAMIDDLRLAGVKHEDQYDARLHWLERQVAELQREVE